MCLYTPMNTGQFRRQLRKLGCTFEEGKRHTIVRLGDRTSVLPRHGGAKQLGTGLIAKIRKDLGIE